MTWWGQDLTRGSFQPKQKSRFIVEFGNGGRLLSVASVTKPSVSIEAKQYQMINHYYNYPGIAKWEPIEIKFVDGAVWGSQDNYTKQYASKTEILAADEEDGGFLSAVATNANFPAPITRMTSAALWEMLVASGYTPPSGYPILSERSTDISSPEKASTMDISFGQTFKIHQLKPEGIKDVTISSSETWEIFNPIITSISWGDLSYADDGLVEYTLSITYDWAIHHSENKIDIEGGGAPQQ